jgi:ABC-type transport system involved in multi-copper enzyme maturation permease subunit
LQSASLRYALLSKAWQESRARFYSALALVILVVSYAILISNDWIARYNSFHPKEPIPYSAFIWSGLFNWLLQAAWILGAFVLGLGGLRREGATGSALFTLALPIARSHLLIARVIVGIAETTLLALTPALLIPLLSRWTGHTYPWSQAMLFCFCMGVGGGVFLCASLLLSSLFEGEFTAPVGGILLVGAVFLGSKQWQIHKASILDVLSAAQAIDPVTQYLHGPLPWLGLSLSTLVSLGMIFLSTAILRRRDF